MREVMEGVVQRVVEMIKKRSGRGGGGGGCGGGGEWGGSLMFLINLTIYIFCTTHAENLIHYHSTPQNC